MKINKIRVYATEDELRRILESEDDDSDIHNDKEHTTDSDSGYRMDDMKHEVLQRNDFNDENITKEGEERLVKQI